MEYYWIAAGQDASQPRSLRSDLPLLGKNSRSHPISTFGLHGCSARLCCDMVSHGTAWLLLRSGTSTRVKNSPPDLGILQARHCGALASAPPKRGEAGSRHRHLLDSSDHPRSPPVPQGPSAPLQLAVVSPRSPSRGRPPPARRVRSYRPRAHPGHVLPRLRGERPRRAGPRSAT